MQLQNIYLYKASMHAPHSVQSSSRMHRLLAKNPSEKSSSLASFANIVEQAQQSAHCKRLTRAYR